MIVQLKQTRPLVVSIDWDYFLPRALEDFEWPRQPDGSPSHVNYNWQPCAFKCPTGEEVYDNTAHKVLRVYPGRLKPFLRQVLFEQDYFHLRVCESHHEIVEFTKDLNAFDLINFDAHHDVGYGDHGTYLNCGNWASYLRESGQMKSYTLVYPRWRHQRPEHSDGILPNGIDRLLYGNWPNAPLKPIKVFVCRSSPWMPSWCDEQWLQFIDYLRERPMLSTSLDAGTMEPRPFDLESACEQEVAACKVRSLKQLNPNTPTPSLYELSLMSSNVVEMLGDPADVGAARHLAAGNRDELSDYGLWEEVNFPERTQEHSVIGSSQ